MTVYHQQEGLTLHHADCLEVLRELKDASVHAIVTDPPYGLRFMAQRWDHDVPAVEVWAECLRVLKPGGHLLAFAGTRTQHRMAVRIEDAGFEIRDMLAWVYGSGFPKSLDVSKAIDKAAGAEREVVGQRASYRPAASAVRDPAGFQDRSDGMVTLPATDEARKWSGWGTALKPSLEPITLARKPLEGTVAANVVEHGTGALHVDGCRVLVDGEERAPVTGRGAPPRNTDGEARAPGVVAQPHEGGRWPANLVHDGSAEVLERFPADAGAAAPVTSRSASKFGTAYGEFGGQREAGESFHGDQGSAARFFYCAKASQAERGADHRHPTVKPLALMRWLVRLVTPPGGVVLDPYMGSGTTAAAAQLEAVRFIGCEVEAEYLDVAVRRVAQGAFDFGGGS